MTVEGVDYSYARPSPSALAAAGKKFAVRYAGPGSDNKHLHADELAALRSHGIDVVANAEGASPKSFTSYSVGVSWAKSAEADFRALGMPASRPIYFSVDWDAGSSDWPGIDSALRGAASVISTNRVGVYGSYDTVAHCHIAGTAKWLWQTYAWSSGRLYSRANMYQYKNGVTIGGASCDLTRGLTADFGQWNYQGDDLVTTQAEFNTLFINALKNSDISNEMSRLPWAFKPANMQPDPSNPTVTAHAIVLNGHTTSLEELATAVSQVDEQVVAALRQAGAIQVTLDSAQASALITQVVPALTQAVTDALVNSPENPLTQADLGAIQTLVEGAVRRVLVQGVGQSQ